MENKFKQVTLRIFKLLPFDKQYVSHATDGMIEYKDKDTNYDYVEFIEIAALEQLKAENLLLKDKLEYWRCTPCEAINDANKVLNVEIQQLKSKIEYANDEIHTLKNKLLVFEGMTFSENQEISALKAKLEIAKESLIEIAGYGHSDLCQSMKTIRPNYRCYCEDATEALKEIGGEI